jgi:hypothetical protein
LTGDINADARKALESIGVSGGKYHPIWVLRYPGKENIEVCLLEWNLTFTMKQNYHRPPVLQTYL